MQPSTRKRVPAVFLLCSCPLITGHYALEIHGMIDESSRDDDSGKPQISLSTLFKAVTVAGLLLYVLIDSWDHLGSTIGLFILLSPFIFWAEIVDLVLGAKRR